VTAYYIHAPTFNRSGICDVYAIDLQVAYAPAHFRENRELWQHVGYVNAQGTLCMFRGPLEHCQDIRMHEPIAPGTTFTF
jgi:hypothetical protein